MHIFDNIEWVRALNQSCENKTEPRKKQGQERKWEPINQNSQAETYEIIVLFPSAYPVAYINPKKLYFP